MNLFEAVKAAVPARTAAEHYGIRVTRNGMACCPFHSDRTPSMKLDRRFHCFGCQADGTVIDFVSRYFDLTPKEAAEKLAQDFGIPYDRPGKGDTEKRDDSVRSRLSALQEYQNAEKRVYRVYCDYSRLLRQWKAECAPRSPDEEPDERFVEACHKLPYVEYLLDTLFDGDIEDRAAIVKEHGKDVIALEKRFSELAAGGTGGCPAGGESYEHSSGQARPQHDIDDGAL